MKLNYREFGSQGPITVILHGLYGGSDNWFSIARLLENDYHLFLIDQRNHGLSPHDESHTYEDMSADLFEFFTDKNIQKANIIGHSMGGKTAMTFTLKNPTLVDKLVVIDIAPKSYVTYSNYGQITNHHQHIISALLNLDLEAAKSRKDLNLSLSTAIPDLETRQFLLKNIDRTDEGLFYWRINLKVLNKYLPVIMDGFSDTEYPKSNIPTVFIKGEKSSYIMEEDLMVIRKYFSAAELVSIPDAGHWVHAEQAQLLVKTLNYFLLD